ncbi:MAG: 16S rRNA (cytidine(1402)-2'-O)-methyltransferase [Prolixibacteraceae bacterium]|jgi:16S rRNA (cytidine1402-2'-O)-methyltransferase|nr:16S rRNA (cytidine(1402)-2'-O)-methyltransferase [Prolixibacteraceae bacterium]MBT6765805.1 16S rRNA (cytidine(1402)-2'-O)-methyltransferase [Prolixibacteraceae bacterium]MBT6999696.1 16S rRNA (cytidine(1402)-2'-O)-methyltransferase [Prolixibacteraceae bacterium]MBT7394085.1 16S rRNA (cytidine(1402)-2'-O)-methyltransferase [Prolixibacteraceae bacterium]
MTKQGKLILVPTPIGNLEDITLRALTVLKEADLILAEDTRVSSKLLNHFSIEKKMFPHHKFNEHKTINTIISKLQQGNLLALISDAGTPGISDPGFLLVRACVENEIEVECLPGPSALIPALAVSGLPTERFVFEGFLPQKKGRQTRLSQLAQESRTMVFYESPFRLVKSLTQFAEFYGIERRACVCRELSKMFEEIKRGTLHELQKYYTENPPKGEIVIVVEGVSKKGK